MTDSIGTDDVLDDAVQSESRAITEFIQSIPDAGAEPSELAEVGLGFDDESVYVAGRIWDSGGPDNPNRNRDAP
ncbi:MAG: hypothetical protein OXT72_04325 [Gammaproteobacteria bacterium]|nr:hypothetical protein [Gammaproteobacteria bacterium]MDE0248759.1 hypothetical protein [Gammaproteobacteria bacterium]